MKNTTLSGLVIALLIGVISVSGCAHQPPKRVGMVVGIREEKIPLYKKLHTDCNPGVRDILNKYNMHNFSIYLQKINGRWYEFGYYEYTGHDFKADMDRMAKEPRTVEWLKMCDPMQLPLPGSKGWTIMNRVYYNP